MPFLLGRPGEGQRVMTRTLVITAQLAEQLAWGTSCCFLSQCSCPFSGGFLFLLWPCGVLSEPCFTCAEH